mmetsp:Transcript_6024/g.10676  ORF Transcript_6024/g.10676 Transcript_6024/m.10676 type:complete len:201 (-) Transcript_6024:214-816(-)
MNKTRGSPWCALILLFLGSVALSKGYGVGPPTRSTGTTVGGSSRASFLQSACVAAFLISAPSVAVATETSAGQQLQAGFNSLNKEVASIDRVLSKQAKKIDRAVAQKTKPVTKKLNLEVKKATKESKKVMKKVDKKTKVVMKKVDQKTQVVTNKAKKLGSAVEKETKAFIGGAAPIQPKTGGIDVSRIKKVCKDARGNCL